jgi:hypothetical protein
MISFPKVNLMVNCKDCGKEISEDQVTSCDMCGDPLCEDCAFNGLCSLCLELWKAEIDLEDNYYEDLEDDN